MNLSFQVVLNLTLSTTVITLLGFWGPLALLTRLFLRLDCVGGGSLGMGSVVFPFDFEAFMLNIDQLILTQKAPIYDLSILIIVQLRLAGLKKEL